MTHDELDTCRICSAPAEPDAPLFHPCKCSGTIRYIHQDCLTTWLAHSKKKTCDVCKHHYSFIKVYSPTMPKQIPFILFLRKFAQQLFFAFLMALRITLVVTIWLVFLPYVTVWTWRFYFVMGENFAWWINDRPRPVSSTMLYSHYANITNADVQLGVFFGNRTLVDFATSYPIWRALSSDIFTGQLIATMIILIFLGIFLLREWIMQNARPDIFDEDDLIGEGAQDDAPVAEQAALPLQNMPAAEPPLPHAQPQELMNVEETEQSAIGGSQSSEPSMTTCTDSDSETASESAGGLPLREEEELTIRRRRRPLNSPSVVDPGTPSGRRSRIDRSLARRRTRDIGSRSRWKNLQRSASEPDMYGESSVTKFETESEDHDFVLFSRVDEGKSASSQNQFGRSSASEPPSETFSFDLAPEEKASFNYSQQTTLPYPLLPREVENMPGNGMPRRPPLPTINLTSVGNTASGEDGPSGSRQVPSTIGSATRLDEEPLASPSLSTYCPPEEFEAGSSPMIDSDYFADNSFLSQAGGSSSTDSTVADSALDDDEMDDSEWSSDSDETDVDIVDDEPLDDFDHIHDAEQARQDRAEVDVIQNAEIDDNVLLGNAAEDPDAANEGEGALEEAIGMRGPLTTVFQNAALMIFVLDTTIGVAVWFPFTIGKTTALLSLEPIRIFHILQWPVYIIRFITDPVVDLVTNVLARVVSSAHSAVVGCPSQPFALSGNDGTVDLKVLFNTGFFKVLYTRDPEAASFHHIPAVDEIFASPNFQPLLPLFENLGRYVRVNALAVKVAWIDLASGDASTNKVFAVVLGYILVGIAVAIYLNVLSVGNVQSAGRAFRKAIRQQLIVLKVAAFIVIELALFPIGCGMMLDFFTLQMFPNTTLVSRLSLLKSAPIYTVFCHWMIGTIFMYQFAILLSGCRKILRPGALWFIKDPRDQNLQPLRDILDRPTLVQLRKLGISAILYSIVVALAMSGLISSLRLWSKVLLPFRWKLSEPLSDVPIDILFLHIVVPATLKKFRPRRIALALASSYWKWAAKQLRISSYMFGGLPADEMQPGARIGSRIWSLIWGRWQSTPAAAKDKSLFEGSYRRVPAQDDIALPRDLKGTVAVDENGVPMDDASKRLMDIQNLEAEKARRDVARDYSLVYLPPHFRGRIVIFIVSLWLVASSALIAALAIPTLLGRSILGVVLNREVHDVYSFAVGFYVVWMSYHSLRLLNRADIRRQRIACNEPRGDWWVYVLKRGMNWAGNFTWAAIWLGFVIPVLTAIVVEIYLIHPLRIALKTNTTLNIRIFDSWALGLLYIKLLLSSMRFRPQTRIDTAFDQMRHNGWKRLDAVAITLDIIAPVTAGLIAMLSVPILFTLGMQYAMPTRINSNTLLLYIYPALFILAACIRLYATVRVLSRSWAQQIRDSEFLVEMRLRNLEKSSPEDTSFSTVSSDDKSTVIQ